MSKKNINESNLTLDDFKVGDRVIYTWKGDENFLNGLRNALHGLTGTVIKNYHNDKFLGIQFDKNLHFLHDCHGLGEKLKCYYVIPSAVEHIDPAKEEERRRKKEELRLRYAEIDPYGEEDWENESKINEIIDYYSEKPYLFNIGDRIICKNGDQDGYNVGGRTGVIIRRDNMGKGEINGVLKIDVMYQIEFDKIISPLPKDFWIFEELLMLYDEEKLKEINKRKDDIRNKMKDVDPYGEEDWADDMYENKSMITKFKIFKSQEEKRLKMKEIDPYGEEDWADVDESKINIILENSSEKIYIEVHSKEEDIILREYLEKLGFRWESNHLPTNLTYYRNRNYVYLIDLNRKRIGGGTQYHKMTKLKDFVLKYDDLKRKKEEIRLKYSEIDPYGEEEWENESIDHSDIDPYGEEDWNEEKDEYYIIETQDRFFLSKKTTHLIMNRYRRYIYNIAWLDQHNNVHFDKGFNLEDPYPVSDKEKDKILNGKINVCYIKNFGNIYSSTLQKLCDMTGIDIKNIKFHKW